MMNEKRPDTINRLSMNVYGAAALLAGMRLDVFTPLAEGPRDAASLGAVLGVDADRLGPLLYALVTTGLLTVDDGRFANGDEADRFLVRDRPDYMGDQHDLMLQQWEAALKTTESVRRGAPQARLDFHALPADELAVFYRRWHRGALASGRELARRFEFSSRRALVDVAGGSGGVAIALCEANPALRATVVDLPETTPTTRRFVAEAGLAERIDVVEADILAAPPPGAYDAAALRAFLQVLGPAEAARAMVNVAGALTPGAAVYITGNGVIDDSRTTPADIVAYSLVYLNYYEGGRAYTEGEYRAMLAEAGCVDVERHRLADDSSIISARKA